MVLAGESEVRVEPDPGAPISDGRVQIADSGAQIFCLNPSSATYPVTLGKLLTLSCASVSSVVSTSEGGCEDYINICNVPTAGHGS